MCNKAMIRGTVKELTEIRTQLFQENGTPASDGLVLSAVLIMVRNEIINTRGELVEVSSRLASISESLDFDKEQR